MAACKAMIPAHQSTSRTQFGTTNLATRASVIALVITAHVAVFSVWSSQPRAKAATNNELLVSFAMAAQAAIPRVNVSPPHLSSLAPLPVPEQLAEQATTAADARLTAPSSLATAAPVVADTEPDYKATYLNNPAPVYPMVARRNGLQGRVLLSVEVLADGVCGQINIQKSSGYAMLDNAAMQTVKTWRFLPARQGGHAVDKWFMIPVQFSLKDNAA